MRVHILCSSYQNPIIDPDRILRRIVRSYPIYSPVKEDKIQTVYLVMQKSVFSFSGCAGFSKKSLLSKILPIFVSNDPLDLGGGG